MNMSSVIIQGFCFNFFILKRLSGAFSSKIVLKVVINLLKASSIFDLLKQLTF